MLTEVPQLRSPSTFSSTATVGRYLNHLHLRYLLVVLHLSLIVSVDWEIVVVVHVRVESESVWW